MTYTERENEPCEGRVVKTCSRAPCIAVPSRRSTHSATVQLTWTCHVGKYRPFKRSSNPPPSLRPKTIFPYKTTNSTNAYFTPSRTACVYGWFSFTPDIPCNPTVHRFPYSIPDARRTPSVFGSSEKRKITVCSVPKSRGSAVRRRFRADPRRLCSSRVVTSAALNGGADVVHGTYKENHIKL